MLVHLLCATEAKRTRLRRSCWQIAPLQLGEAVPKVATGLHFGARRRLLNTWGGTHVHKSEYSRSRRYYLWQDLVSVEGDTVPTLQSMESVGLAVEGLLILCPPCQNSENAGPTNTFVRWLTYLTTATRSFGHFKCFDLCIQSGDLVPLCHFPCIRVLNQRLPFLETMPVDPTMRPYTLTKCQASFTSQMPHPFVLSRISIYDISLKDFLFLKYLFLGVFLVLSP